MATMANQNLQTKIASLLQWKLVSHVSSFPLYFLKQADWKDYLSGTVFHEQIPWNDVRVVKCFHVRALCCSHGQVDYFWLPQPTLFLFNSSWKAFKRICLTSWNCWPENLCLPWEANALKEKELGKKHTLVFYFILFFGFSLVFVLQTNQTMQTLHFSFWSSKIKSDEKQLNSLYQCGSSSQSQNSL